jgi:hypothetical protein
MQQTGFIKVFRSITNKGWYKDSECVALWLHLLLKANHKEAEFMLGYSIIKLLPGQLVTGRKALSYETGISESKIERILKLFEIEQQIEQQTNSRNRIITILSWDAYQKSEQQMDSPRTASEQPVDTNNKNNNNKNDNNEKNKSEFDNFWNLYDKKVGDKEKVFKKWSKLKPEEKEQILIHVPKYTLSTPDKKFRLNPETYINNKGWNNEIIFTKKENTMTEVINPDKYANPNDNKYGIKVL